MTTVINLFGGSGVGKSTVAALLFANMKIQRLHVELVREYVKLWAWSGKQVRPTDQLYLLGKQSAYESLLYGKVDYIVTDSPIMLAGAYSEWHSGKDGGGYVTHAANSYCEAVGPCVRHINYVLERSKVFDPRGRYETREQAEAFDDFLKEYLEINGKEFVVVGGSETEKAQEALARTLEAVVQGPRGESVQL